ncbi:carbohydrate sulfotransferase 15-like [Diadema antillarum]
MAISKFNSCREKLSYRACAYSPDQIHHGYFARILIGLYAVFTRDWLRAFPREQLRIVRMEDWQVNCTGILTDIFSFLTLGNLSQEHTAQICEATPQNSNKAKLREVGGMLPQTVSLLEDFYQRSNEELSQLLGKVIIDMKNAVTTRTYVVEDLWRTPGPEPGWQDQNHDRI